MSNKAKFPLGEVVATSNALESLTPIDILSALFRHHTGDWGDVDEHDRQQNEFALQNGLRLMSVYHSEKGVKFYIVTEASREITTVLLPEDY